ncbi:MAG: rhodanese-like domain-containing protein [Halopseudomonas sp.]
MLLSIAELAAQAASSIRTLCADSAHKECGQHPDALIIDVREPLECQQNPIQGSINIPRGILEAALPLQVQDPHHPIYLHCASGMRATLAAEQLTRQGYTRVSVIHAPLDAINKARSEDR